MTLDADTILRLISQAIWPTLRIAGMVLVAPLFSSAEISSRVKAIYIMTLGWLCAASVPTELSLQHFDGLYFVYVLQELSLGLIMGFVLQLVFQIFVLAGQIISMQAGLGFAVMNDPDSQASVPYISHFYITMVTLVFLVMDGHLVLLDTLLSSFEKIPIGHLHFDDSVLGGVINFSGWMFKKALLIAIPATLSLLIVSLAFGIMTRVSPQLNIFSLGFPITLFMGFVIIKIGLPNVGTQMVECIEHGLHFIQELTR